MSAVAAGADEPAKPAAAEPGVGVDGGADAAAAAAAAAAALGAPCGLLLVDGVDDDDDDDDDDDPLSEEGAGPAGDAGDGPGAAAGGGGLSDSEEAAVHQFLEAVNPWRSSRGYEPLQWTAAVKFLMARKFHVDRALYLYQQHEVMRLREGLSVFNPDVSPLKEELLTKKFTILPAKDANGATLALFNAHRHDPQTSSHRTTLQCVVYQLDVALEELRTQRGGLVFIYNMSGSKYANFDYDLSQKMLTLLKGAYPARLKKVLIVTAPLWFKAPFKVLRLFVREKLRDRVFTVSIPQLQLHVPAESIPTELGGRLEVEHDSWLQHCAEVTEKKDGELITMSSSQPTTPAEHKKRQPTLEQLETLMATGGGGGKVPNGISNILIDSTLSATSSSTSPRLPPPKDPLGSTDFLNGDNPSADAEKPASEGVSGGDGNAEDNNGHKEEEGEDKTGLMSSTSSGLSEDEAEKNQPSDQSGMTLPEFIEHVRSKGRRGLYEEYSEIKNRPPMGTFNHSRLLENQIKNRYTDVLCYDHSRVDLKNPSENDGDYINANFVDGYKQPAAFISSQGPLPRTFPDFWQMVWEQRVMVIVMTTKTVERHRTKCGQYWPSDVGATLVAGRYEIHSEEIENCEDFVVTHLTLTRKPIEVDSDDASGDDAAAAVAEVPEVRKVCHFQFVSWPDYGVPDSAVSMLHFLQRVREKQADMVTSHLPDWTGHPLGPPIVVHCSAGIGRTGTFATLDAAIRKFNDIGRVDIRSTVERIRSQRAFSIQMPDQYVFCHLAFLEYVLNMEYVEEIDLTGFDDDCDSE